MKIKLNTTSITHGEKDFMQLSISYYIEDCLIKVEKLNARVDEETCFSELLRRNSFRFHWTALSATWMSFVHNFIARRFIINHPSYRLYSFKSNVIYKTGDIALLSNLINGLCEDEAIWWQLKYLSLCELSKETIWFDFVEGKLVQLFRGENTIDRQFSR